MACEILADADANRRRGFQVVKKRDVGAFRCVGARWEGAEVAFQQTQQRIEPLLGARKLCKAQGQRVNSSLILRRCQRIQIFQRQPQLPGLRNRRNRLSGMLPIHMGKHGHKRQIAPETCFLRVYAAPVGRGGDIVRNAGDPRRTVLRGRRGAERGGMVQPDAVEDLPVAGPELFQVRIAETAVVAALPARALHWLSDVVQQAAEAGTHTCFIQHTSRSFV